jgi:hypothetical protein
MALSIKSQVRFIDIIAVQFLERVVNISIWRQFQKKSSLKLAPINRNEATTVIEFFLKKEYICLYFFVLNLFPNKVTYSKQDNYKRAQ